MKTHGRSLSGQSNHNLEGDSQLALRFRKASRALAGLVAMLGLVVMGGWVFQVPAIIKIRTGFTPMQVNTAILFVLLGAALWMAAGDEWHRSRRIIGAMVVFTSGLTLAEYGFDVSLGIDQLLFSDPYALAGAPPGRIAMSSSICFLLLGLAVLFMGSKRIAGLQHAFVLMSFAVSLVGTCGYLYGVQSLYSTRHFSSMAIHTAVGLVAACMSYFLGQPEGGVVHVAASDSHAGFLLRNLLPAVVIVPVVLGWIAVAGERYGLYDAPFGTAILVLVGIGCLTAVTMYITHSLYISEAERRRDREALKISEQKFSTAFRQSPMALTLISARDYRYIEVNDTFELATGWHRDEVIGRSATELAILDSAQRAEGMKRLHTEGTIRNMEVRFQHRDGTPKVGLASAELIDVNNEPCVLSVIADITDRKLTEEKLRESGEYSRELVLRSPVAMVVTRGPLNRNVIANYKFVEMFGYTIDDVPDEQHWWPLAYPDEVYREQIRADWEQRVEVALQRGIEIEPMEATVQCKDGSTRHIEFHFSSLGDTSLVSFVDLTDRQRAQVALKESEERFRLVANAAPVLIWMSGTDKLCTYFNQSWLDFTGKALDSELGNGWAHGVHAEDLQRCMETYSESFDRRERFEMEYRLRRQDGEYRWILDAGVPRFNVDGNFAGYIGSCVDLTDRKLAEEALASMGRKLMEVQEEERRRIARELHDDVVQRIALVSVQLEQSERAGPHILTGIHDGIQQARQRLSELAKDIQALSHRLHSSKLDYLGLVTAAKSFCRELGEQRNVRIEFKHSDVPADIPKEISLCLFRVLQEALQNAAKHSSSQEFTTELHGTHDEISLTVTDKGIGFNSSDPMNHRGLGLVSMRERVRLVNGSIEIESKPAAGTKIHVRVPIDSEQASQRAAG